MPDLSIPLIHRGAEALESLLNYDPGRAEQQIRLLTLSELTYLRAAARQLAELAGKYVSAQCGTCGTAIVWDANDPTQQLPRWRHVDQVAAGQAGAHRAGPSPDVAGERC